MEFINPRNPGANFNNHSANLQLVFVGHKWFVLNALNGVLASYLLPQSNEQFYYEIRNFDKRE